MAFRHGKNAAFWIGTNDLSAFLDNVDKSLDVDTAETSTFGVGYKTFIAGLVGGNFTISGDYDGTASTGPSAVIAACISGGTAWSMKYFPGGSATGQRQDVFSGIVTGFTESSSIGDAAKFGATVLVSGTVTSTTL